MSQRIALGFGNNVDYEIVWHAETLNKLAAEHLLCDAGLGCRQVIHSERELIASILGFVKAGQGGERFVADSDLIEWFASRFQKQTTLGGTPVRAAIAMGKLGHTAALHLVSMNADVRRLLPPGCPWVCSNPRDSHYPHLIVQYDSGASIRVNGDHIVAPAANRLIYHSNADNIAMRLNRDFADLLPNARALLVSGFNAMQSEALLIARLETLSAMLETLPADAVVVYEDGGYHVARFRRRLQAALGSRVDVHSMNEDELQEQIGAPLALDDARAVLAALDWLHRRTSAKTLVVHTGRWALAYGGGAQQYAAALRAGATLATTRFCYGDGWKLANYRAVQDHPPKPADACFAAAVNASRSDSFCVPVAWDEPRNTTSIGLGDAFVGGFMTELAG
ncbi:MAG: hypothetical protein OXE95_05025 [Chloroflexi bacterium]|nr:hypothetical protein [Chloroflexota bacterium]MCY4246925.1 hypothetical protein [Chloroflexota bacterium]